MSMGNCRDQKRVLDLVKLKLQVVVSCLVWVLRLELGSSGGDKYTLSCWSHPFSLLELAFIKSLQERGLCASQGAIDTCCVVTTRHRAAHT